MLMSIGIPRQATAARLLALSRVGIPYGTQRRSHLAIMVLVISCIVLALSGLAPATSYAGPAWDGEVELTQPDGQQFEARLWGDEFANGWETLDGHTIVQRADGWWVFAGRDAAGEIVPSQAAVGQVQPPAAARGLRPTADRIKQERDAQLEGIQAAVAPQAGTFRVPIIVVSFQDDDVQPFTKADFDNIYFGKPRTGGDLWTGPGSMRGYFEEVSYGKFHLDGGTPGVITVKLSRTRAHYMKNEGALVNEAIRNADRAGVDFPQFDNDGDGVIDAVTFLYSGCGPANGCDPTAIWPHFKWGKGPRVDGKEIMSWTIQPAELDPGKIIAPIGTVAHELGHVLGLPDLYDADGGSGGIGNWGLMGSGNWLGVVNRSDSPAHLSAWSKSALGWLTPVQVRTPMVAAPIPQVETSAFAYQFLDNPNGVDWVVAPWGTFPGTGEYFLVENRARVGFDSALPGQGLLIWHVDEAMPTNRDPAHKLLDLEEADGLAYLDNDLNRGDGGDPYPGTSGNRVFGNLSNPNSNLYSGASSGVNVWGVSAPGSTMTAHFFNPKADLALTSSASPDPSILDGKAVAGGYVTYNLLVKNLGPQNTVGVKVSDVLPAGVKFFSVSTTRGSCAYVVAAAGAVACDIGDLSGPSATDGSDEAEITIKVRLPSDLAGASLTNLATAISNIADPDLGNNEHTLTTGLGRRANIETKLRDGSAIAGNDLAMTTQVINRGPSNASDATITLGAPDGMAFKSWTMPDWSCSLSGSTLSCTRSDWAPNSWVNLSLVLSTSPSLPHLGQRSLSATAASATVDPDPADNVATGAISIERQADLQIGVAPVTTATAAFAGASLTYRVTVNNLGPSDAARIEVADSLPGSYVTFVSASPACPSTVLPGCSISDGTVTYRPGGLAAGADATFEITIKTDPATPSGTTLTNTARVVSVEGAKSQATPDPVSSNNASTSSIPVLTRADLVLTNEVSATATQPGGKLSYKVTVTNRGPSEALAVKVENEASGPVRLEARTILASPQGECTASESGFTCDLGTLAPGAAVTVEISGQATAQGTISNWARVTSATQDRERLNNEATAVTTVGNVNRREPGL